ncbi:MAG: tetratricopeptide repeat protein, partial [Flavobacteriales bacterium]
LSIRDSIGADRQRGSVMNNLGILHYSMGNLEKARSHYRKAIRSYKEHGKDEDIGDSYTNIALIHRKKGRLDSSLLICRRALKAQRKVGDKRGVANCYINLGLTSQKKGKLDSAIHYFKRARSLYDGSGTKGGKITAITNIAGVLLDQEQYRKARSLAFKAYRMAASVNSWAKQKGASAYIARASAAIGDSGTAYRFQKIHDRVDDSLLNKKKSEQIARMEARYRSEKRKKQLEREKAGRRKAELAWQRIVFISIGGLGFLLFIIVFLIVAYRQKRNSNQKLEEQRLQVQKERDEKNLLLKELNHRVKNNLQLINSILSLQGRRIEDQELQKLHIESQNRVQSMGILHERIYKAGEMEKGDLDRFVADLTDRLKEAYGKERTIDLDLRMDDEGLSPDSFTPIALILNELISNSLKYGFKDRDEGVIRVELQPEQEGHRLEVADDGVGFDNGKNGTGKEGLGLGIVRSLSEQLGGSLEILSAERGSRFRIAFKGGSNDQ